MYDRYSATCGMALAIVFSMYSIEARAQDSVILTVHVVAADLDLSTPAGQRKLDRRVTSAVNRVCNVSGVVDLTMRKYESLCRNKARHDAETQVASVLQAGRSLHPAVLASVNPAVHP